MLADAHISSFGYLWKHQYEQDRPKTNQDWMITQQKWSASPTSAPSQVINDQLLITDFFKPIFFLKFQCKALAVRS